MNVSDFDFDLPDELVAQHPAAERGRSRLLLLDRHSGAYRDSTFTELPDPLRSGDLLVLNDTRVFPARLLGHRVPSGGAVEVLLLRESEAGSHPVWEALVHPGQKLKPGARMRFDGSGFELQAEILAQHFYGRRTLRLWREDAGDVAEAIDRMGHIPLPPYIKRDDTSEDRDRYQTVYARARGSIAAPTAGLHFTPGLLDALTARGIERIELTLHVGYGTFQPVRVDQVEDHIVESESFTVTAGTAAALTRAKREGRRVIAVGTTTTRALESLRIDERGQIVPCSGSTQLFIHPGHQFTMVDGLMTNFHLPRSSLLMLVAAFAGRERVLAAYRHAVEQRYRFYSYGDAMLIL
jgi:S-adenosylmethionine:tRNA ribosyltransferase-isomerase